MHNEEDSLHLVLNTLFDQARTAVKWLDKPVPDHVETLLYNHVKWGPTSANSSPARFVFIRKEEDKQRILPALSSGNIEKVKTAPLMVIIAYDPFFYDQLNRLWPHEELRSWFVADSLLAEETAQRNSTLQGAYLLMAARLLGLDAAPLSGFDSEKIDHIFLSEKGWKSNFLMGLGYADPNALSERRPRLPFEDACWVL